MANAGRPEQLRPLISQTALPRPIDGERALVEVAERRRRAGLAAADRLRHVVRLLDRDGREPRQRLAVAARPARHVADHGDLGMPGDRQVGVDLDAPAAVGARPGGARQRLGQRRRRARRPPRSRVLASIRSSRSPTSIVTPPASIAVTRAPSRTVTPEPAEPCAAFAESFSLNAGTHAVAGVEQDHARLRWGRCAEVALHRSRARSRELRRRSRRRSGRRRRPRRSATRRATAGSWPARPPRTRRRCGRAGRPRRRASSARTRRPPTRRGRSRRSRAPQARIRLS